MNNEYRSPSAIVDFDHPLLQACASRLAGAASTPMQVIEHTYTFVRDEIRHCTDHRIKVVTCKASDVLQQRASLCYGKSHLLAALLRAQGFAVGFCYQRLSLNDAGAPYCLHGLNAVYLQEIGWYRLDARGNKAGIHALFCPPDPVLAFSPTLPGEYEFPEVWAEPLSCVVQAHAANYDHLIAHLPDMEPASATL